MFHIDFRVVILVITTNFTFGILFSLFSDILKSKVMTYKTKKNFLLKIFFLFSLDTGETKKN